MLVLGACLLLSLAAVIFTVSWRRVAGFVGITKYRNYQPDPRQSRLMHFLESPAALLIGLFSSVLGIFSFFDPPVNIFNDNRREEVNIYSKEKDTVTLTKQPTRTPLAGIEIKSAGQGIDYAVTQMVEELLAHHPQTVIRGQFSMDPPSIVYSSLSDTILGYKVGIALQFYQDGLNICNRWHFATYLKLSYVNSIDLVKQEALTVIRQALEAALPAKLCKR